MNSMKQRYQEQASYFPNIRQDSLNQISIIGMSELAQIKHHISGDDINNKKITDQQSLWAKRILKQRQQKETEQLERFIKEEEQRRKIDQEELEYQNRLKKELILDSNQKIFNDRADVRGLKQKMLLSEIEKTNQQLVTINKEQKEFKKIIEEEKEKEYDQIYYLKEQEKLLKEQIIANKQRECNQMLAEQHRQIKDKYLKDMIVDKQEGQLIKKKAEEDAIFKENEKQENKQKQIKLLKEHEQFMNKRKERIELEKSIIEEEDKIRDDHEIHKEKVLQMRKEREIQKQQKKDELRKQIYDLRLSQQKQQEDNYISTILRQQEEKKKKDDEEQRIKQEERIQMIQEAETMRQRQLRMKEQKQQNQKIEQDQDFQFKIKALEQLDDLEKTQNEILKKRNKDLQQYQKIQIETKKQLRKDKYMQELKDSLQMQQRNSQDKQVYSSWAQQCIEEWKDNGKNILPMVKALYETQ